MPYLKRTWPPERGTVLFAMPYGKKKIGPGNEEFDFDEFFAEYLVPIVERAGMKAERLDGLFGPQGVLDLWWRALQRCEMAVFDFTGRSANVNLELGMAMTLGKKCISITQDPEDIPTDIRGQFRYIRYSDKGKDLRALEHGLLENILALREEPSEEMTLAPLVAGTAAMTPAKVTSVEKDVVWIQTVGDRRRGFLTSTDVDYTRVITDMRRRFKVGDELNGAFTFDIARQEMRYTLLVGQDNPWPQIAARYPVGSTFTSVVVNVHPTAGVFVRILGGINGLIPHAMLMGEPPATGSEVEVVVSRVDPSERRVSLELKRRVRTQSIGSSHVEELPAVGSRFDGEVVKAVPLENGRGGYVLLRLDGHERPAMLLARDMLDDLREDLQASEVRPGDMIFVEVTRVDAGQRRVLLKDLGEHEGDVEVGLDVAVAA